MVAVAVGVGVAPENYVSGATSDITTTTSTSVVGVAVVVAVAVGVGVGAGVVLKSNEEIFMTSKEQVLEYKRQERKRKKDYGWTRLEVWVHHDDVEAVKAYARKRREQHGHG